MVLRVWCFFTSTADARPTRPRQPGARCSGVTGVVLFSFHGRCLTYPTTPAGCTMQWCYVFFVFVFCFSLLRQMPNPPDDEERYFARGVSDTARYDAMMLRVWCFFTSTADALPTRPRQPGVHDAVMLRVCCCCFSLPRQMPDLPDHASRVHNAVVLRVCVFSPLPRQMLCLPDPTSTVQWCYVCVCVFSPLPRQMPDLPDPASAVQWCYVCVCVFPPSTADARPTRPRQPGARCSGVTGVCVCSPSTAEARRVWCFFHFHGRCPTTRPHQHNAVVLRVCMFFLLPRQMPDLPDPASRVHDAEGRGRHVLQHPALHGPRRQHLHPHPRLRPVPEQRQRGPAASQQPALHRPRRQLRRSRGRGHRPADRHHHPAPYRRQLLSGRHR